MFRLSSFFVNEWLRFNIRVVRVGLDWFVFETEREVAKENTSNNTDSQANKINPTENIVFGGEQNSEVSY